VLHEDPKFVVVASGVGPHVATPAGATVIAADGGLERAAALGLDVAVAIGDFDSATPQSVDAVERRGARVVRHPAAKDATDLELALDEAVAMGARSILVIGSDGGRLDHLTAGMLLLGADSYREVALDAVLGETRIAVVRSTRTLAGEIGDTLTLPPVNGAAAGVTTTGLEYPLRHERLEPGSTRGVSNVFAEPIATVTLEQGTLLALRPGRIP
jgi:thiamine pyrophosphokinase